MDLEDTLNKFIVQTSKSKVAVVVPLFGFWSDQKTGLNAEILTAVLNRLTSSAHHMYLFIGGEKKRLPLSIVNILTKKYKGGNTQGITIREGATYPEYIREMFDVVIGTTDARFILVVNPWVIIQEHGIDIMIDRINRGDVAVVSGYEMNKETTGDDFDEFRFTLPKEIRAFTTGFWGMTRQMAEMLPFDMNFNTSTYFAFDLWQSAFRRGFELIVSQKVPVFSLLGDTSQLEDVALFNADKETFLTKWHFEPVINEKK